MKIRIYEEPVSIIREADRNRHWGYEVDLPIDIVSRFRRSLTAFRKVQAIMMDTYDEAVAAEENEREFCEIDAMTPVDEQVESLR